MYVFALKIHVCLCALKSLVDVHNLLTLQRMQDID